MAISTERGAPRVSRAVRWKTLGIVCCVLSIWSALGAAQDAPPLDPAEKAPPSVAAESALPTGPAESTAPAGPAAAPVVPAHDPSLDGFPSSSLSPVLLLTEGLDSSISLVDLRRRLSDALAREVVPLVDARARRAQASIWLGLGEDSLVLRVTPPQRAEVWRQLARKELGPDPVATIVKAVLEMLWADAFARLDMSEVQDPFCPSGMICVDPRHATAWPQRPEVEVLDPWDPNYPRFYGWDRSYPAGSRNPWAPPYSERGYRPSAQGPAPAWSIATPEPAPEKRSQTLALGLLAGGGVHKGGAFLRYEVNLLRRFPRFDFGLTYVAARGQPEPFQKARRSILAMLQRRFISPDFELDLGISFGMFVATLEGQDAEVRPYLRGLLTFALPISRSFDLLVQSELGTTFATVTGTGAVEYALTAGFRHKF